MWNCDWKLAEAEASKSSPDHHRWLPFFSSRFVRIHGRFDFRYGFLCHLQINQNDKSIFTLCDISQIPNRPKNVSLFVTFSHFSLSRSLFSRILLSVSPFVSVFLYLFYLCASARMWNPFSYWLRCEFNFLFGFIQPSIHSDRSIVCYCGCCCWVFFFSVRLFMVASMRLPACQSACSLIHPYTRFSRFFRSRPCPVQTVLI